MALRTRLAAALAIIGSPRSSENLRRQTIGGSAVMGLAISVPLSLLWAYVVTPSILWVLGLSTVTWLAALSMIGSERRVEDAAVLSAAGYAVAGFGNSVLLGADGAGTFAWLLPVGLVVGVGIGPKSILPWTCATGLGLAGSILFSDLSVVESLEFATPRILAIVASSMLAQFGVVGYRSLEKELRLARSKQQAEAERVNILLDVATIANGAETFREAGDSVLELLDGRFSIVSARIIPEDDVESATLSTSSSVDSSAASHVERIYPIRLGGQGFGSIGIKRILDDESSEVHHVLLGVAGHLAQVALREQTAASHLDDARSDELTGLPNRRGMQFQLDEALARGRAEGRRVALLYLDLNGFKGINDTFGHESGDAVLQTMSRRLAKAVRLTDSVVTRGELDDSVARIGGDEFCVILDEVDGVSDAEVVANRIIEAVVRPVALDMHEVELGAAIGIAVFPDDAEDASELLRVADMAMYWAKSERESCFRRYVKADEAQYSNFLLAQELRTALDRGDLEFYLQPVFDGNSGMLVAAEALVRWNHAEQGWIPPSTFVPIAENAGLIKRLGRFVLHGAYEWLIESADRLPEGFRISINASAKQLEDPSFAHEVAEMIACSPLAPDQLELEVTETVVLEDSPGVWEHIRALAGLGVTFALDDFGTGYSSLSLLKRLPIHRIKIDQSFVRGLPDSPDDIAIVMAIIGMARSMNLPVLAEGVENEEQFDFLVSRRCSEIQGYLLGKPGPPNEILRIHAEQVAPADRKE